MTTPAEIAGTPMRDMAAVLRHSPVGDIATVLERGSRDIQPEAGSTLYMLAVGQIEETEQEIAAANREGRRARVAPSERVLVALARAVMPRAAHYRDAVA